MLKPIKRLLGLSFALGFSSLSAQMPAPSGREKTVNSLSPGTLAFLRDLSNSTLKSCSVPPGAICDGKTNTLGFTAITPGGYPAIWVQDFTMNYSSGLISREDGNRHLQLILESQNGDDPQDLGHQVIVPANAIPDHINVDGSPVYFPGTYDPNANMKGAWGFRPASNNQFDVIWLAQMLSRTGDAKTLLNKEVKGKSVYDRLKLAFEVPEVDAKTELVHTTLERRAVGFIFCDSIQMTGDLLMASLIRYRAALQLSGLAARLENAGDVKHFTDIANTIRSNIMPIFKDDGRHDGWLKASTGISGQADVWGSIYAVYIGVLVGEEKTRMLQTIVRALEKGDIEFEGALRHVPLPYDFSATAVWERTVTEKNRYQNGAYWHTPTGWLVSILQHDHPEIAQGVLRRWIDHLHAEKGKVWECIGWEGKAKQNPSFAPSITLPLGVLSHGEGSADMLESRR